MNLIQKEDLGKFKKLKISNILELSLITPIKYSDYRLKSFIPFGDEGLFEVETKSIVQTPKYLKIDSYCKNIEKDLEIIFFKYSSYHKKIFKEKESIFLYGKFQYNFSKYQLIQPKKINDKVVGTIYPNYKTVLRADVFMRLIKKYINKELIEQEGVDEVYAKSIEKIHFPDDIFLKEFNENRGFFGKYLEALKYVEIFNYLKKLKSKRVFNPSLMQCGKKSLEPFLKALPFKLTNDQLKAILDIKNDLTKTKAAKRMIIGDVGSGKSMVMFAAAYLAYPKKSILMAPTTILANQLYEEAKKYLKDFKIALVTSSTKNQNLSESDFIIGTHALLYKDLPKVCVVMVDEQHRFGTNQRAMIKKMLQDGKKAPHYFQFSATPIPRSKAMIDSSLIDFSFIKETPFKKDITTKVISKEDFRELLIHIKKEIENRRQILIVYPLIEESENYHYKSLEEAAAFWKRYFKNVYITHGKDKDKESVLIDFREQGDILLATTVIEVGISLPRLSTIVIVGAENLGLATLHQLRGRVSRSGIKGYCFLYTKDKNNKRLNEFAKISSGFEIAELDLKYRQSGDILDGKKQSGKTFKWIDLANDKEIIQKAKEKIVSSG